MEKRFLRYLIQTILLLLLICMGLVLIFDPFYHYHKPLGMLKAVLTQPEYQVIGTLKNFDYDSLIVGSSEAENYNNSLFDEEFSCKVVKAVLPGANTTKLTYLINEGYKSHDINYIFYSLDISALIANPDEEFPDATMPGYLYDSNPFNDVSYLFNRDILFEHIPYMLAQSFSKAYKEEMSYSWGQYKEFSKENALKNYVRPENANDSLGYYTESTEAEAEETKIMTKDTNAASNAIVISSNGLLENNTDNVVANIEANVNKIENIIKAHPETEFIIFFPPYSILWWDDTLCRNQLDITIYAYEYAIAHLAGYENVRLCSYLDATDITMDLDNYMDTLHFSMAISDRISTELDTKEALDYTKSSQYGMELRKVVMDEYVLKLQQLNESVE